MKCRSVTSKLLKDKSESSIFLVAHFQVYNLWFDRLEMGSLSA